MARNAAWLFVVSLVLGVSVNAAAQGLLGEKYVGVTFDEYWASNETSEQGMTAGVNAPLGSRFDVGVSYSRVGFERPSGDMLVLGLGLSMHGGTEGALVPFAEVSGGAAFDQHDSAYSAALDAGTQFALSSRVALTPRLGAGAVWAEGVDTIKVLTCGLSADVHVTQSLVLLLGGSLDYNPDLPSEVATSETASVGLAFLP